MVTVVAGEIAAVAVVLAVAPPAVAPVVVVEADVVVAAAVLVLSDGCFGCCQVINGFFTGLAEEEDDSPVVFFEWLAMSY